jgi:hypothetical protein
MVISEPNPTPAAAKVAATAIFRFFISVVLLGISAYSDQRLSCGMRNTPGDIVAVEEHQHLHATRTPDYRLAPLRLLATRNIL